jgi:DNA-binding transcriptional regulator YiaG
VVNLMYGGRSKRKRKWAHRLVLEAFVCKPKNGQEANHINGIKSDNRLMNLEWVTKSQNAIHAHRILHAMDLKGAKNPSARNIDGHRLSVLRKRGMTQSEVAVKLGISRELVNRFENGRHWSQRGINT